jgi:shikimate kinase
MSIEHVSEKEQRLAHHLAEAQRIIERLVGERDAAYERAAQVCDEAHELMNSSFQGAAAAIRALKEKS